MKPAVIPNVSMKKSPSKSKTLSPGFRVVALGGGTGLSTLLRGLKELVIRRTEEHASANRPISDLAARSKNVRTAHGETRITASRAPIKKIKLSSRRVRALPLAIEAIKEADLILLGPGSLYTSILPNLLIPEIAGAIAKSKAPRVYVANLMTQPGATAGYALADHLRAIQNHTPRRLIDWVVANRQPVSP